MKLKLIALAALLATAGTVSAAPISNGADGNGGLFFTMWDAAGSYSRNLGLTIDGFEAGVAAPGAIDLSFAADSVFTSFLGTVDLGTAQWNIAAVDNVGARRLLETYTSLPGTTKTNDSVRSMTTANLTFVTGLNQKLASADSATYLTSDPGYGGILGNNVNGVLNFNNAGTFATNSVANSLGFLRINASATGIAASTYTPYLDGGNAVRVYLDTNNTLHVAAVPEADTYAMMLAGLGLMGAMVRRRRNKQA